MTNEIALNKAIRKLGAASAAMEDVKPSYMPDDLANDMYEYQEAAMFLLIDLTRLKSKLKEVG